MNNLAETVARAIGAIENGGRSTALVEAESVRAALKERGLLTT